VEKLYISHEKCPRKSKKIARKIEANVVVAKNEECQNVTSIITSLGV
jgi:hypothetical protein